jgi:polar amino acid transport system substrate-binding protein
MFNELARRLNFTPVFIEVPFADVIDHVAAGIYDVAGDGIAMTYERAGRVDFSREYALGRQRVAIRAGEQRFQTIVQLKADPALIVGAEAGSANYATAVAYFGADRVQALDGFSATMGALRAGTIDGAVVDDVAYWAERAVYPNDFARLPGILYGDLLAFIFPKGSDLIDPINQAITAMDSDGTLDQLNQKWLPDTD